MCEAGWKRGALLFLVLLVLAQVVQVDVVKSFLVTYRFDWGEQLADDKDARDHVSKEDEIVAEEDQEEAWTQTSLEEHCEGQVVSKVEQANCGTEFHKYYDGESRKKSGTKVGFLGKFYEGGVLSLRRFSGCPLNKGTTPGPRNPGCLQDETCFMYELNEKTNLEDADVVVVTVGEAEKLSESNRWDVAVPRQKKTGSNRRRFRVLYVREPVKIPAHVLKNVDLTMGTFHWNDILNPNFLVRPVTFANRNRRAYKAFKDRSEFGMSLISNCEPTRSRRGVYLNALADHLGKDRVHQFGKCGDGHHAPEKPLDAVAEIATRYKFYFSFENTVEDGYVTEKLFKVLTFGPVPIYLGAPDVPKITKVKSFINVMDFSSPQALADYLLYLNSNVTAYEEYHQWRFLPPEEAFDSEYLDFVSRHLVSRKEYQRVFKTFKALTPSRSVNAGRIASCCKLCNLDFLEKLASGQRHLPDNDVSPWGKKEIMEKLFGS